MTQEEQIARWRLILGSESQPSFDKMGGVSMTQEQDLMDQALSAIYGGPGESFGGSGAGKEPSSPHISKWLGDLRSLFDSEIVAVVQNDAIERKGLQQLLMEPGTAGASGARPEPGLHAADAEGSDSQEIQGIRPEIHPEDRGRDQPDAGERCAPRGDGSAEPAGPLPAALRRGD